MTPKPKITGWSTLLDTPSGRVVLTVQADDCKSAAETLSDWLASDIQPRGMFRTVTTAASDHGNPLFWAAKEMELDKCEPCE